MPAASLHHVALAAPDLDAAVSFYREAFGFEVAARFQENGQQVVMLRGGNGAMLEVFGPSAGDAARSAAVTARSALPGGEEASGVSPLLHIAVGVGDVDAAAERCRQLGVSVTREPADMTLRGAGGDRDRFVRYAFVRGPCGESIEIVSGDL